MDPEQRKLYISQTNELYQALGGFVSNFELLVQNLRTALVFLMSGNNGRQDFIQSALAELSADPMLRVFKATFAIAINECGGDEKQLARGRDVLKDVCRRTQDMIAIRNEIVHGTWFIGWAGVGDEDFSVASGGKTKNTRDGVEHRQIDRTKVEFDLHSESCLQLADLINRLQVVILHSETRNFIDNFEWTEVQKDKVSLKNWSFKWPRAHS